MQNAMLHTLVNIIPNILTLIPPTVFMACQKQIDPRGSQYNTNAL